MADNTSILASTKESFINNFADAYYWDPSGIPLVLYGRYSNSNAVSNDIVNTISKKVSTKEDFINIFEDAYYWQPSGIPLCLNSSYYTFNVISNDILNIVSKKISTKEDFINIFEDAYYWQPSGIPVSLNSSYVRFDAVPNPQYFESSKSDTLSQQLPSNVSSVGQVVYFLRARDSSLTLTNPLRYVYWVSSSITLGSYLAVLPGTGPLVDLVIMSKR